MCENTFSKSECVHALHCSSRTRCIVFLQSKACWSELSVSVHSQRLEYQDVKVYHPCRLQECSGLVKIRHIGFWAPCLVTWCIYLPTVAMGIFVVIEYISDIVDYGWTHEQRTRKASPSPVFYEPRLVFYLTTVRRAVEWQGIALSLWFHFFPTNKHAGG